jgi:hypothetical protein
MLRRNKSSHRKSRRRVSRVDQRDRGGDGVPARDLPIVSDIAAADPGGFLGI